MEDFFTAQTLIALGTLTALEIVLGIDNVIFIAILSAKLPEHQQERARTIGIGLAVLTRILLLLSVTWIMRLTEPIVTILGHGFSGRDLILLFGGLFLIGKSTFEIHEKLEVADHDRTAAVKATFAGVIFQIVVIDIVFSLDSVITAVGISGDLRVMIPAVVVAAVMMLVFSGPIARFVERHPTFKILALAFLIMIGALLVIEALNPELVHEYHLRNYVYFAMLFSVLIELINMRIRRTAEDPVQLHNRPHLEAGDD